MTRPATVPVERVRRDSLHSGEIGGMEGQSALDQLPCAAEAGMGALAECAGCAWLGRSAATFDATRDAQ